jgi:hypothetical protein
VVKGKRREMNRVAAKRHREKNKDRLKSVSLSRIGLFERSGREHEVVNP